MPSPILFEVDTHETEIDIAFLESSLQTAQFVPFFDMHMLRVAHQMQADAFEGQAGGSSTGLPQRWPALSDWSTRDRGSASPIMIRSESFKDEVMNYEGQTEVDGLGATFTYPHAASGKYYGLTAGQRVNPLAGPNGRPIPLKNVPRPILFGGIRLYNDANILMAEWFGLHGIELALGTAEE